MREKDRAKRRPRHGLHGRDAKQAEWSGPDIDRATLTGKRHRIRMDWPSPRERNYVAIANKSDALAFRGHRIATIPGQVTWVYGQNGWHRA